MARFRKIPIIIEAEQWWPGKHIEGVLLEGDKGAPVYAVDEHGSHYPFNKNWAAIKTLEGILFVQPGDWIITGVQGEKYLCKPDIFDLTYEPVD